MIEFFSMGNDRFIPPIERRFQRAHDRLRAEGGLPRLALVVIPSPEYDVPVFNLCSAELAGYLRHCHPALRDQGIELLEPDILFSRTSQLADSPRWILERLDQTRPHIIGLSAKIGSTENLRQVLDGLERESWADDSVVVVGNVVSTFSHEELTTAYPRVVFAVGDGEIALERMYRMVRDGESDLSTVANLVYLDQAGEACVTRKELLAHHEQHWLPAFDLLRQTMSRQGDIVLRTTTGCSAHCTFCSIRELNLYSDSHGSVRKAGWRSYPPQRTAATLRYLASEGVERANFADDEFGNVDFDFLEELADLLIADGNRVRFNVSMRLDAFWTPSMPQPEVARRGDVLAKLIQGGLDSIFAGAESGSPGQLRRYGKGYPVEVNLRSLELLLRAGVKLHVGFIPFDQFVSRYELEENLRFLETAVAGHPVYRHVTSPINVMRVQRGTPYESLLRRAGLLGPLESNLSFYDSRFVDARMELVGATAKQWYEEIGDSRYPLSQLRRYAAVGADRAQELLDQLHRLDIDLVRALVAQFPEDEGDREFAVAGLSRRSPELTRASARWAEAASEIGPALSSTLQQFRQRRAPIEAAMKDLLLTIYGREKDACLEIA